MGGFRMGNGGGDREHYRLEAADLLRLERCLKRKPAMWARALTGVGRLISRGLRALRLLSIEVQGRQYWRQIPRDRGVIIAPEHSSRWDALMIYLTAPRNPRFIGAAQTFVSPIRGTYIRAAGHLPVTGDNSRLNLYSLLAAKRLLQRNGCLTLFGEGDYRTKGTMTQLLPFSESLAQLALATQALVVPTGLQEVRQAIPWSIRLKRLPYQRPVRVLYGEPIDPSGLANTPENRRQLTLRIIC
jgi:1-acyl-sn-glycerol-3-phosphate acyltransferase